MRYIPNGWLTKAGLHGYLSHSMTQNEQNMGMGGMGGMGGGGGGGGNPFGGMGGMGGMGDAMGKAQEMMKNPKVMQLMAKAQSNPRLAAAMQECMTNPAAMAKYQNDPEVKELLDELKELM